MASNNAPTEGPTNHQASPAPRLHNPVIGRTQTIEQVQAELKVALEGAGYLRVSGKGLGDTDHKLGEFWFDKLYEGLFMRRVESVIPEAKRR